MKKLLVLFVFAAFAAFACAANAQGVFVGTYANDAGQVVITNPDNGAPNNYQVAITDKSGQCNIKINATTNKVTATGKNGAVYNITTLATVQSVDFPGFALWPEDETIKLAKDALPFDKLDPACQAFKDNMTFTRQ